MAETENLPSLMKSAAALMKRDVKEAVVVYERAFHRAVALGVDDDVAFVAETLARAWMRAKSPSRGLRYARVATKRAPEERSGHTTLGNVCELLASNTDTTRKARRARRLYDSAAEAFAKAAALTKDREDRQWLVELSNDAARASKAIA
ncbi:MAG: hypothetical protein U0169_23035 [Polyangiaceae bacterium]